MTIVRRCSDGAARFGLLTGLAIAGAAGAQETVPDTGGDVLLDAIEVTGVATGLAAGTTEGTGLYAAPATNTATKFALTPRETPQSVAIVTSQVMRDFQLTSMKDVLDTAPFINVYTERSPGVYVANSRGIAEFNTQFDGIPGSGAVVGRAVIPFNTAFLDRTEIIYGPQGLLVGAGGSGGVINMVRKMPTEARQIGGEVTAYSEGGYRIVGDVSGPLNAGKTVRGRLVGVIDDQDSFVDHVWYRNRGIYGVVEADVREGTTIAFGGMYADYDAAPGAGYGNPAMLDGSFADLPRSTNLGADWARDNRTSQNLFVILNQDLPGDWELRGAFNYVDTDQRLTESNPAGPFRPGTDYEFELAGQKEGWDETIYGLDTYAAGTAQLFGRTHELMAGFNAQKLESSSIGGYYADMIPGMPGLLEISHAFDHDPTNVPEPTPDQWVQGWGPSGSTVKQYGVYAGGRFSLAEPLHLLLGGRATWWQYDSDSADIDETAFTPYTALTYDFSSWGTVYASYSKIFQPTDWALDTDLRPLDPVEGSGYEVGVKGSFLQDRLNASLTLFRLDQENMPEEDLKGPWNCDGNPCYKASGMVKTQGVEIGFAGQITPDWSVLAGYSFWEYVDGKSADWGHYNPQHQFKVSTTYDLPGDRWIIGGQVRYQSGIAEEGEFDGTPYRVAQPGYTLVDLMAAYRITEKVSLQLNVDNVFDKVYHEGISWPAHGQNYGAPRSAGLSLSATF